MTDLTARIAAHPVAAAAESYTRAEVEWESAGALPLVERAKLGEAALAAEAALIAALDADDQRPELARLEVEALTVESRRHRGQRDTARAERDQVQAEVSRLRTAAAQERAAQAHGLTVCPRCEATVDYCSQCGAGLEG